MDRPDPNPRTTGYLYPWDVVGDPDAPARVAGLGVGTVALAAAYHSVRAATPRHPQHRVVEWDAACYVPVRPSAWAGSALVPAAAAMGVRDPYGEARDALLGAGVQVDAWTVFHHSTPLGRSAPDVVMINAFGDRYPYAPCPAQPAVLDHDRRLLGEVITLGRPSRMIAEAVGFLGFGHQSRHEKTGGSDWTDDQETLLSLSFCSACVVGLAGAGVDVGRLRGRVRSALADEVAGAAVAAALGDDHDAVLAYRHGVVAAVAELVLLRSSAAGVPVVFHTHAEDWSGVPARALAAAVARTGIEATFMISCWGPTSETGLNNLAAARAAVLDVVDEPRWAGYVTVLPPGATDPAALAQQAMALRSAGIADLHLYHLGLASTRRAEALVSASHLDSGRRF